ncbi:unnamed protein product, partial [Ixodes pacificus]
CRTSTRKALFSWSDSMDLTATSWPLHRPFRTKPKVPLPTTCDQVLRTSNSSISLWSISSVNGDSREPLLMLSQLS